jgi:GTP-binding protein Era
MSNDFDWPDQSEYEELEADLLIEEDLPPDHRSGFVAVIGRPNVGKSTLMNYFLGQKIAITSAKPQTTRNQLLGILTLPTATYPDLNPAQVIFLDTPGIHRPKHKLGEILLETALETIPVADATEQPTGEDRLVAESIQAAQAAAARQGEPPAPVLLALNKIDLCSSEKAEKIAAPFLALHPVDDCLPVSAARGDNRLELLRRIIDYLPPGPRYYPEEQVTDQQTRFIAAELIREAALRVLHEEIPHALAVQVTEFKPRHEKLTYVSANLILERQSQKKIVIGHKGKTLKKIGQLARPQIEELVGAKIYLDLWVKIRPKWRKKENELRWLGYSSRQ